MKRWWWIVIVFVLSGCTSEFNLATRQEETLLFSTEKEIRIGEKVSEQFEEHFKIYRGVEENERVQKILDRLVEVCDRNDVVYTVRIIDEDKLNAVALPGGPMFVFKGVIDKADNDDQLAGVIAHEIGHITARHGIKKLQASYGYALATLAAAGTRNASFAQGVQTAYLAIMLEYSQQDELQADELGIKYMKKAGYQPEEMVKFLAKLKAEEDKEPLRPFSYGRTHPYIDERIAAANVILKGRMDFRDYIKLTK